MLERQIIHGNLWVQLGIKA